MPARKKCDENLIAAWTAAVQIHNSGHGRGGIVITSTLALRARGGGRIIVAYVLKLHRSNTDAGSRLIIDTKSAKLIAS